MLNSDVLEVATGLVFIYLLLSLITTSLREALEALAIAQDIWPDV